MYMISLESYNARYLPRTHIMLSSNAVNVSTLDNTGVVAHDFQLIW